MGATARGSATLPRSSSTFGPDILPSPPEAGDGLESTRSLLALVRAHDPRAEARLYKRFHLDLFRWAHGRLTTGAREENDTQDVVQIAFSKAFLHLDAFEYRYEGSFRFWLRQILRRVVLTENRKRVNRPPHEAVTENTLSPLPTPEEEDDARRRIERYEGALETLGDKDRELIGWREVGMTNQEIADQMGLASANAARMALARALERLTKAVASSGPHGRG